MVFKLLRTRLPPFKAVKNFVTNVCPEMPGKSLDEVVSQLESFAPTKFAESWDNVGLLLEPHTPRKIQKIFLTNDLTEPVMTEALKKQADMIISYHPPIFAPMKRISQKNWKERIVSICLENKIALYSPHTSWDFAKGGVGDWLASSLPHLESCPIQINPECNWGIGRLLTLKGGVSLKDAIERVKMTTGIADVRVAIGKDSNLDSIITTVAVCPGSGATLFKGVQANLYLTGEMSHHEVLDAAQNNISVILCNHSNSERGYLKHFKSILEDLLGNVAVVVSENDADPLQTY